MSGELAQRSNLREHKRIPKFDNVNLEVSVVYAIQNVIETDHHAS